MKINVKTVLALLTAAIFIAAGCTAVFAAEIPDVDRECSATFTMKYADEVVGGGELMLYLVGDVAENNGDYFFEASGKFAESGEELSNLEDPELAARLLAFAQSNEVSPEVSKKIDSNGKVSFEKLKVGLYLVAQQKPATGFEPISPYLISLPYLEDGVYKYDLDAEPKTELVEAPTTVTEPDSDIPQTGQLWWPVPMLVCGGLALVIVGFVLIRRKKSDEV